MLNRTNSGRKKIPKNKTHKSKIKGGDLASVPAFLGTPRGSVVEYPPVVLGLKHSVSGYERRKNQ